MSSLEGLVRVAPRAEATPGQGWVERHARLLVGAGAAFYALLALANARFGGGFWPDENFYVVAAQMVRAGHLPYADFAFTQGPLAPYVYAPASLLGRDLLVLRLAAVAMGAGALLLAARVAWRAAGPFAAVVCAATMALTAPFVVHTSVVSPIPVVAFLLALGAWALTTPRLGEAASFALAGVCVGLAAATRVNLVVVLPALVGYALLLPGRGRARRVLAAAGGGAFALGAALLPFLLADADALAFNLVRYHVLDSRDPALSLAQVAKYKLDGLHYFATRLSFATAALALAALLVLRGGPRALVSRVRDEPLAAWLGASVILGVGVTFTKVYVQDYYLVMVLPLAAILAGILCARLAARAPAPSSRGVVSAVRRKQAAAEGRGVVTMVVAALLAVGFVGSAPPYADLRPHAETVDGIDEMGAFLEANVAPGRPVLTFLGVLALEADRPVVRGMEMGAFGHFPAMDTATAERYGLLNAELALRSVRSGEPGALVLREGDFTFTPSPASELSPEARERFFAEMDEAIEERYVLARTFGEGEGSARVYLPR